MTNTRRGGWMARSAIGTAVILSAAAFLSPRPAGAEAVISTTLGGVKVYPNPWNADKHGNSSIKFENLPPASMIKLFTVSGHEVKTLSADGAGLAAWDRTNFSGDRIASGVYIYLIIDPQGNETSGKLAIIN